MLVNQAMDNLACAEFGYIYYGDRLPTYNLAVEKINKIPYNWECIARREYIRGFGFTILTHELIAELVEFIGDKKVADIGCGTGYITHFLRKYGASVTPIDTHETKYALYDTAGAFTDLFKVGILNVDGPTWVRENSPDVVLMSWPDHEKAVSVDVLRAMKVGSYLIHSGDGAHGCTGCDEFYDVLMDSDDYFVKVEYMNNRLEPYQLTIADMRDSWTVYKKVGDFTDEQFVCDEDRYVREKEERYARFKEYALEVASGS